MQIATTGRLHLQPSVLLRQKPLRRQLHRPGLHRHVDAERPPRGDGGAHLHRQQHPHVTVEHIRRSRQAQHAQDNRHEQQPHPGDQGQVVPPREERRDADPQPQLPGHRGRRRDELPPLARVLQLRQPQGAAPDQRLQGQHRRRPRRGPPRHILQQQPHEPVQAASGAERDRDVQGPGRLLRPARPQAAVPRQQRALETDVQRQVHAAAVPRPGEEQHQPVERRRPALPGPTVRRGQAAELHRGPAGEPLRLRPRLGVLQLDGQHQRDAEERGEPGVRGRQVRQQVQRQHPRPGRREAREAVQSHRRAAGGARGRAGVAAGRLRVHEQGKSEDQVVSDYRHRDEEGAVHHHRFANRVTKKVRV